MGRTSAGLCGFTEGGHFLHGPLAIAGRSLLLRLALRGAITVYQLVERTRIQKWCGQGRHQVLTACVSLLPANRGLDHQRLYPSVIRRYCDSTETLRPWEISST